MRFKSEIVHKGDVMLPKFSGLRLMMMPFDLADLETLPLSTAWRSVLACMRQRAPVREGIAYLTIDEALVRKGETHRRPGLHVDGIGPDGEPGGWGGGGGWAKKGMLVVASHAGSVGWHQEFDGEPAPNGDCSHLSGQCKADSIVLMTRGSIFHCNALAVHQALRMVEDTSRQFVRLSLPNDCPWYEGYTENPLGIEPTGPIHPARQDFMSHRP
jgi:hypothetical protein